MRYKLDSNGYITSVAFGCYLIDCVEYTGLVPAGYVSLDSWSETAYVNAYYIDANGNLVLDKDRLAELKNIEMQQMIDNTPLYRKDLYGSNEVQENQYKKNTREDYAMVLPDCMPIGAKVTISNVSTREPGNLHLYVVQGTNMLPSIELPDNVSHRISSRSGVSFTVSHIGQIAIRGTATSDIEYVITERTDGIPAFVLKANEYYSLRLGGLRFEMQYYDGVTTVQQYEGYETLLKFDRQIKVSRVAIKIRKGQTVNTVFYPQLEHGFELSDYEKHKSKILTVDLKDIKEATPSNTLYPRDDFFINPAPEYIDISIENGRIYTYIDDEYKLLGTGYVTPYKGCNTIYTSQTDTAKVKIEYSTDALDTGDMGFLQGTSTTTNKFKILEDGTVEIHEGYISGDIVADSFKTSDNEFRLYKDSSGVWNLYSSSGTLKIKQLSVYDSASISGSLSVSGTKSRFVDTESYGERLLYCYETPSPMFGDLGEGLLDETGKCYVFIDDVFAETVDSDCAYQVFLQPYGDGKCYVEERTSMYFVVRGTAVMRFGWELKCIQKNYDTIRLEEHEQAEYTADVLDETSNYINSLLYKEVM